jgi:hypothetical protein
MRLDPFGPALTLFLWLFIYVGLRRRRAWAIPLVLMSSATLCATTFLSVMAQAPFLAKHVNMLLFLSCAWQLLLFSKATVRAYFADEGTTLFFL